MTWRYRRTIKVVATDLLLYLEDQPGELARLGEVLGKAGVNIDGLCALSSVGGHGQGEVHVLINGEAAPAFTALTEAQFDIAAEQEVLVIKLEDRPGALGEVARRLGDAGVNITSCFLATGTRLVLAADNLELAQFALE